MFRKPNTWKFFLSALVLIWCVVSLVPLKDIPLEAHLSKRVSHQKTEFESLLAEAQLRVKAKQAPSLYNALKQIGSERKLDLSQYFPDIKLADVKNIDKRNDILLGVLYNESKGKLKFGLDLLGGLSFKLKIDDARQQAASGGESQQQKLQKTIDILDKRINSLGVVEPMIRAEGDNVVSVQLPGVSSKGEQNILDVLKKPAKLSFHKVHPDADPASDPVPPGYMLLKEEREDPRSGDIIEAPAYVKRIPEATGEIIAESIPSLDPQGNYYVGLNFTPKGAQTFAEITAAIVEEGKLSRSAGRLAIVLDGVLYSAPRVNEEITGGRASITGNFTQRQVIELSNVLNNPLEFELSVEEMSEVGPSLAKDARNSSIKACLLGATLVMIFMLLYYGSCGLVAILSVAFNLLIVIGAMASIGATITLPGIAALVLTVGMGVDANILIFERMREEIDKGFSIKEALRGGYQKVFSTILDANVTTLLTAFILILMGTGAVKGFGVTLAIGICASVFCAMIVSRMLLELLIDNGVIKKLSLLSWFKKSQFEFLKYRRSAFLISMVVLVLGLISIAMRQDAMYTVDFTGGDLVSLSFKQKPETKELEAFAQANGFGSLSPVYERLIGENQEILKVQCAFGRGPELLNALQAGFPDNGFVEKSITAIGPAVTNDLKFNALMSLIVAMIGILIYIGMRFETGYGMGALISTIHDVVVTVGIFALLGGRFSAPMVASILMIIGYSINDTIVVFDRIREELETHPSMGLGKIINLSINQTLSRTLLTSLTTFMSAFALFWFGAGVIDDFALVFLIGIITGTFSSIFIASPVFYWWHKGDRRHINKGEVRPKYAWESDK